MDYYRIGYIANTLGVKGELKVLLLTDNANRFNGLKACYVDTCNGRLQVEVEKYRPYKANCIALKLRGYDNINSVLDFKGKYLEVDKDNLARLEEGHYYIFEIIGCRVLTMDGASLGSVADVLSQGANDLYVVTGEKGEILIPAVKEMVKDIDIIGKTIRVDLPEGLIE